MEWPGLNDITPQRRPRRASTFPARFTQPGQPEVRVEQIGPRYEIWPAAGDASRRGLVSEYEDPPDWDYPRRYRSSSRERIVPVIEVDSESTRPKSVRHNSRFTSREGRRRRKHTRSISPPRVMGISPPRDRSKSSSEDGSSNPSYSSVPYEDYRRSSRRHRSRVRYDSSDESEGEWDVNQRAYTFSLPRRSRSPNSQDSVLKRPTEPSIKTESNSELQVGIDGPKLGTTLRVFSSKYTGEGSVGGSQSAQMKVIHDQKKGQSPLFRWM